MYTLLEKRIILKEQLLDHIHQALAIQLNELTAYYEQQITKLKRENGALLTKVHKLEKQVAELQKEAKPADAPKMKMTVKQPTPVKKQPEQTINKPVATAQVKTEAPKKQQPSVHHKPASLTATPLQKLPVQEKQPSNTAIAKPTPKPRTNATKSKHAFSLHNFHIIQEADLKLFCDEYELEEREITVALFDAEGVEETDQTAQLRAYVNPEQTEAFIVENAYKAERQKFKPYRLLGSRKHYTFDWATEHILQKEGSLKRYLNFGPDSELEDFGYQVRTLTKEERWAILQNAVPIIGLEKAVDTIANHIMHRKAEENGEQFYAKSIVKWKNDLIYLKKHFYNNEFAWPKI